MMSCLVICQMHYVIGISLNTDVLLTALMYLAHQVYQCCSRAFGFEDLSFTSIPIFASSKAAAAQCITLVQ